jgi:hypothetical protein
VRQQYARDGFTRPAPVDQRTLIDLDGHLLAAAPDFEAVELAPLAPLGVCSTIAPTSQNRIVSALRGTEVVSDPTNLLALECAARLQADAAQIVRLATSHRATRAQPVPKGAASRRTSGCSAWPAAAGNGRITALWWTN